MTFRNSYCAGGHGLSIGSLGKGGQWRMCRIFDTSTMCQFYYLTRVLTSHLRIENIVTKSCLYGARFKSWTGGNGLARQYASFPHLWKQVGLTW